MHLKYTELFAVHENLKELEKIPLNSDRFSVYLRAIFQAQAPSGSYLEGRFNGGFFCFTGSGGL